MPSDPNALNALAERVERASGPVYPSRQTIALLKGSVSFGFGMTPHPADGMVAHVDHGDGAVSSIIDPTAETSAEWVQRYGDPESIRYTVASLLSSYDYLLSDSINMKEAIKRLMLMRRAAAALRAQAALEGGRR